MPLKFLVRELRQPAEAKGDLHHVVVSKDIGRSIRRKWRSLPPFRPGVKSLDLGDAHLVV
jgi:hypothetical protein